MNPSSPSATVHQTIFIKEVVTEDFKAKMVADMEEGLQQGYSEYKSFESSIKKQILDLTPPEKHQPQIAELQEELKKAYTAYFEGLTLLKQNIQRAKGLKIGSLFDQGKIDGIVHVKVGDDFNKKVFSEIVLKEGIVQSIR